MRTHTNAFFVRLCDSRFKTILAIAICLLLTTSCGKKSNPVTPPPPTTYPFQDTSRSVEERVTNLVSLMTVQEKINALSTDPSVPRLGVNLTPHIEGLHGAALGGPGGWGGTSPIPTTQFPQAVGLGETWDPDLIRQAAAVEGEEARWIFQTDGYHRGALVIRAPNVDLDRDPRWGRSEESYGEDAFFNGTMATAFVRGLQGDDPRYWQTAALLKHFMANSNENGRDSSSSNFDERLLREYYSVPFRMGIVDGGARAFMTSYNAVNGTPMTVHPMLKNMVKDQWGFDGIICTDYGAMTNLYSAFHYSASPERAAADSIHAGTTQFLDDGYLSALQSAVSHNLVTEAQMDERLKADYRVMIKLGLLDPPAMVPYTTIHGGTPPWQQSDHQQLARRVTQESIVLLKNTGILPLNRSSLHSVAVIGPYANIVALDWYSGLPPYTVSLLDGIRTKVGSGVTVTWAADNTNNAAVNAATAADVAIVVIGNHPTCNAGWNHCPLPSDGKEAIDRQSISLEQEQLAQQVLAANPRTVVVLHSSFPYTINWSQQNIPAILKMAHNSQEEGNALADVLFGDYNPAGRLVMTWPSDISQLPPMMDYNIRNGRTYMYFTGTPLYPFGYGLSYTTFTYSNLRLSNDHIPVNGQLTVSVDVTNSGTRTGDEVVQMYVQYPSSAVTRPIKELKGFRRINLQAGQTRTVDIPLAASALAYYNETSGQFVVEQQPVRIQIGASSADIRLETTVPVTP